MANGDYNESRRQVAGFNVTLDKIQDLERQLASHRDMAASATDPQEREYYQGLLADTQQRLQALNTQARERVNVGRYEMPRGFYDEPEQIRRPDGNYDMPPGFYDKPALPVTGPPADVDGARFAELQRRDTSGARLAAREAEERRANQDLDAFYAQSARDQQAAWERKRAAQEASENAAADPANTPPQGPTAYTTGMSPGEKYLVDERANLEQLQASYARVSNPAIRDALRGAITESQKTIKQLEASAAKIKAEREHDAWEEQRAFSEVDENAAAARQARTRPAPVPAALAPAPRPAGGPASAAQGRSAAKALEGVGAGVDKVLDEGAPPAPNPWDVENDPLANALPEPRLGAARSTTVAPERGGGFKPATDAELYWMNVGGTAPQLSYDIGTPEANQYRDLPPPVPVSRKLRSTGLEGMYNALDTPTDEDTGPYARALDMRK